MNDSSSRITVCVLTASMAGCAAVPSNTYTKIPSDAADSHSYTDSFYLNRADIVITRPDAAAPPKVDVELAEYQSYKVGITPKTSLRVKTTVNITKVENTDRVSAIGVETTDRTVDLVNQIGGFAVKLVGLGLFAAPRNPAPSCIRDSDLPVRIKLLSDGAVDHGTDMRFGADGVASSTGCVTLHWNPAPPDIVRGGIPFGVESSSFYFSACRSANLSFDGYAKEVRLPDPTLIQAVQLPYKGSIQMHSICGVSVTTDASGVPASTLQVLDALAANVQAIKDAKDKK